MFSNYLSNDLFITQKIDFSYGISLYNTSISKTKVNYILSQHYFSKTIYFSLDFFQGSVIPPILSLNATYQMRNYHNGVFLVDEFIDFYLSSKTITNNYDFSLTYSASNLPSWLNFDSANIRFTGLASFENVGKNFSIKISGSNIH